MNAVQQLLIDHIEIWTAAETEKKSGRGRASGSAANVYGIKKLRELILDLAVRGKLVPQDANDEPARELLERIQTERARLVAEKITRKGQPLPPIDNQEKTFDLPCGWEWVRLGLIGDWGAGATPLRSKSSYYGGTTPWFKSGELIADFIDNSEETVTHLALQECSLRLNQPGDVLIAMYGATIGKTAILKIAGTTNQAVCACTPNTGVLNLYMLVLLKAMRSNFIGQGAGGAQPNISREKIIATVIALPSTEEQHRIVAKVDELMALCDQLEAQHSDANDAHEQLVSNLLGTLTQSPSAADFNTNWQRIAAHFDALFTTRASIDALKQTLLQLAVMGKLVAQDGNDEPAREFLERQKISSEMNAIDGWSSVPLGKLGVIFSGATPSKAKSEYWTGNIPWISPKDMKRLYIGDAEDNVSDDAIRETSLKLIPSGSILVVVRGMILAHSFPVALTTDKVTINQDLKALVLPEEIKEYVLLYLRAMKNYFVSIVDRSSHGTCKLLSEKLWPTIIAIPPLSEQLRIVTKVNELMALCDHLRSSIAGANHQQKKLADVLIDHAVMG
ncbi:MAG: restriction endonuclease subunit S [Pseudomonadota bacterium]